MRISHCSRKTSNYDKRESEGTKNYCIQFFLYNSITLCQRLFLPKRQGASLQGSDYNNKKKPPNLPSSNYLHSQELLLLLQLSLVQLLLHSPHSHCWYTSSQHIWCTALIHSFCHNSSGILLCLYCTILRAGF